ncbi:MAG: DUF58 domain-containing protein [Verrucomicrobiota bacterium]
MEGLWSGLHRSPFEGFSVEFTEYRQYAPGDDLRYLDWKVLARADREYIKKFEDETNLRALVVADTSRSMSFASGNVSKMAYARTLAATFAYFLLQQRDIVGLGLFDDGIQSYVPPRWRPGHFKRILSLLEGKARGQETNLSKTLEQISNLNRKRSLIIVVSDFLTPVADWEKQMSHLVAAGHDVRAVQILDPAEESLEYGKAALWEDLETGKTLYVDPPEAAENYKANFSEHQSILRYAFEQHGVRYQIAKSDTPLYFALLELIRTQRSQARAAYAKGGARK